MTVTIYHNPACSTSRTVLAMIRQSGAEPVVVEYLKAPPDAHTLRSLIARAGLTVRQVLRRRGTPYDSLGLDDPKWSDEALLELMVAQPILIERPIVATDKGVVLARPAERVREVLPNADPGSLDEKNGRAAEPPAS